MPTSIVKKRKVIVQGKMRMRIIVNKRSTNAMQTILMGVLKNLPSGAKVDMKSRTYYHCSRPRNKNKYCFDTEFEVPEVPEVEVEECEGEDDDDDEDMESDDEDDEYEIDDEDGIFPSMYSSDISSFF
jgi:hypothetical protein